MPWPKGKKMPPEMLAKRSKSFIDGGKRRKKPVVLDGMNYWKCGTCKIYKPEAEFYMDGKTASGVSSLCRRCHNEGSMRTRDRDNARAMNSEHMRRARAADPEKFRARERLAAASRKSSPEKLAARQAANNAVKRGELIKPAICETCGKTGRITGHHTDYSKPLEVTWLCYACHGKEHRRITP